MPCCEINLLETKLATSHKYILSTREDLSKLNVPQIVLEFFIEQVEKHLLFFVLLTMKISLLESSRRHWRLFLLEMLEVILISLCCNQYQFKQDFIALTITDCCRMLQPRQRHEA